MPVEPLSIVVAGLTLVEKLKNLWPKIIITASSCIAILCVATPFGHPPDEVLKGLFILLGLPESWRAAVDSLVSWLSDPVRVGYVRGGSLLLLSALYFLGTGSELEKAPDGQSEEVVPTRYGANSAYIFIAILLQTGWAPWVALVALVALVICLFGIWIDRSRRSLSHSKIGTWAYGWLSGVISPPFVLISLFFSLLAVFAGRKKQ